MVYAGAVPFTSRRTGGPEDAAAERETGLLAPGRRTKLMVIVGNPDLALQIAQTPVDGVGLARLEFIIAKIGMHPMARAPPPAAAPAPRCGPPAPLLVPCGPLLLWSA